MLSRILASLSLIVCLLNAAAHIATFFDGVAITQRQTRPLHVAALGLFFAMVGTLIRSTMLEAVKRSRLSKEELCHFHDSLQTNRPRFFGSVPLWMVVLGVVLFLYCAGVMLIDAIEFHGLAERYGQSEEVVDTARLMKQLTPGERERFGISEVRNLSVLSASFAFWSFAFFASRQARAACDKKRDRGESP
ncbi:MAG: hypothetical protein O3C40_13105 [Planctomycetota bacterium]|nr:hypothetical protein [Planctomycetota bacterium]